MDKELVQAIARLNPNTILTMQVRAGDLAKALLEMDDGPEQLSPGQAAKKYGRSAKYWRTKAEAGLIEGAYKDGDTERWYLPRDACRAHLRGKVGRYAEGAAVTPPRSVRRGGRQKRTPRDDSGTSRG